MFRKVLGSISFAVLTVSFFAVTATAQTAVVSGVVELKTAENKVVPIEGAIVEVYRTDTKSGGPSDKTDKKGQFSFAGILLGGTYVLAVSAPGASPSYFPNIKPGQASDNIKILLEVGDGRKLTADEVRQLVAASSGGGSVTGGKVSEEDKKAEAERLKEVARIEDNNKKILANNVIVEAALKDGNTAFQAKDFDLAIAKYDEGINASPTFVGTAPVLMNNKGTVLRQRAIDGYNAGQKLSVSEKIAAMQKVKADLGSSAESFSGAFQLLKGATPANIKDPKRHQEEIAISTRGLYETFRLMALTEQVDDTKLEIAKTLLPEYIALETDAAKKESAKLTLGDLYRAAQDSENASVEYRKVVEASPDNLDALAGLGLSLVNQGYIDMENGKAEKDKAKEEAGKAKLQEGSNFLQKFASAAPDSHKYKGDAVQLIESLKADQKITPQKVAPAKRRGN